MGVPTPGQKPSSTVQKRRIVFGGVANSFQPFGRAPPWRRNTLLESASLRVWKGPPTRRFLASNRYHASEEASTRDCWPESSE